MMTEGKWVMRVASAPPGMMPKQGVQIRVEDFREAPDGTYAAMVQMPESGDIVYIKMVPADQADMP